MPKYRYIGTEPCRYGSGLIMPDAVTEMTSAPSKHFVLVPDAPVRAVMPPRPKHTFEKMKEDRNG